MEYGLILASTEKGGRRGWESSSFMGTGSTDVVGCDCQGFPLQNAPAALAVPGEALKGWGGTRVDAMSPGRGTGAQETRQDGGLQEATAFGSEHVVCVREATCKTTPGCAVPHRCGSWLLHSPPSHPPLSAFIRCGLSRQGKTVIQAEIDAAAELIDFFRFNAKYALELEHSQPLSVDVSTNSMVYRGLEVRRRAGAVPPCFWSSPFFVPSCGVTPR